MKGLIDPDALIVPLKEEYKKVKQAFDETSVFQAPNDVALYGALMQELGAVIGMIEDAKTIDAVPLDGSFLKMSKGDYLIYNRHWLYEHFDMEMEIQRSAMKSMGYEYVGKNTDTVRHGKWIGYAGTIGNECSVCGKWIDVLQGTAEMNYCPNCGARMDAE